MNALACPWCTAGRPGCEYGVSLFRRVGRIASSIPETLPDVLTPEQQAAIDEFYWLGDQYLAHIGFPVHRDRGV